MPSLKSLESIPDCPPSVSRFLGAVDQAPDAGPSGPDAFRGMPTLVSESESETTASDESLTPPSSPGSSSPSPVAHTNALQSLSGPFTSALCLCAHLVVVPRVEGAKAWWALVVVSVWALR